MSEPMVLVHGGAGSVPEEQHARHREGCVRAALTGGRVLQAGGGAVEAACEAVKVLEDDEAFNAGTGCALDLSGGVSLDAAVMCGHTHRAGAMAHLPPFRNPVEVAACLLEAPAIMLAGEPAALWAESHGFERLAAEALITPRSEEAWRRVVAEGVPSNWAGSTVGAVARDAEGRLAAATSTGGAMGKQPGRVGDVPVIGSGTYADTRVAVSATGEGEAFMRAVFAARLADAVAAGAAPAAALEKGLAVVRDIFGGRGGAILLTCDAGPFQARTTATMSHAWWTPAAQGSGI